jgi:hypothetical protein
MVIFDRLPLLVVISTNAEKNDGEGKRLPRGPAFAGYTRSTFPVPRPDTGTSFAKEAYAALKRAVTAREICDHAHEIRRLPDGLGVSHTLFGDAVRA